MHIYMHTQAHLPLAKCFLPTAVMVLPYKRCSRCNIWLTALSKKKTKRLAPEFAFSLFLCATVPRPVQQKSGKEHTKADSRKNLTDRGLSKDHTTYTCSKKSKLPVTLSEATPALTKSDATYVKYPLMANLLKCRPTVICESVTSQTSLVLK